MEQERFEGSRKVTYRIEVKPVDQSLESLNWKIRFGGKQGYVFILRSGVVMFPSSQQSV